mmetsp:Transcript_41701/g.100402  ORF Transcript_41701/g.100402 Transcript_41701/m.100402 type:complete len:829 (+) Transcript_41701:123-2609(+)
MNQKPTKTSRGEESKPLLSSTISSLSSSTQTPPSPPEVKRTSRRTRQRVEEEESSAAATASESSNEKKNAHKNYNSISSTMSTASTSSTMSTTQENKLQSYKWNTSAAHEANTMNTASNLAKSCKFLLWVILVVGVGYHLGLKTIQARLVMKRDKGAHQQPTLLSIVDPQTMDYIRSRRHYAQYQQWLSEIIGTNPTNLLTTMSPQSSSQAAAPLTLTLDKTEMRHPRESLTVSWEQIANSHYGVHLHDEDLIALHCTSSASVDDDDDDDDDGQIEESNSNNVKTMEIATIAQAKATSQKHAPALSRWYQHQHHHHEWIIPAFPMVRESHCWFTLYSSTTDDTAANDVDDDTSSSSLERQYPILAHSPIFELSLLKEKPTNVHLARGDDPTKMIVHFSTGQEGHPLAMYGIGSTDAMTQKQEGVSTTFGAAEMCSAPANETDTGKFMDPGFLHTVELVGLQPNTVYSYKVGLTFGQGVVWSDTFEFTSPVTTDFFNETSDNDNNTTYTYLVYGDQGCPSVGWGEGGKWTSAMAARETDAREVHHIGDLSYARGAAHIWDEWLAMVSDAFATKLPLMVAVGNHEYDHTMGGDHGKDPSGLDEVHGFMPTWGNMEDDSGGECGVPVSKHFQMPASSPDSNGVFWYSYDSANVHTIVLSSEHDLASSSVQYQWLEADLSAVNRTITPWVVVELHRPLYFNEALWPDVAVGIGMRQEFENLLKWYNVDLVVAGHVHSYFRSCAGLWHSQCNNGGPTHLVVGAAGAILDNAPTYSQGWAVKNIQGMYGYGRITVHNETWMHFEFVQAGPDDDPHAGDVLDEVWITHSSSTTTA